MAEIETTEGSVSRVRRELDAAGIAVDILTFEQATRTAAEAAEAVGCRVEQIVKSLVFRLAESGEPLLVLAGGANRVDEKRLRLLAGERVEKADAAFVRSRTGFAIGGVAPCGHLSSVRTLLDEDLLAEEELWAAAGTPNNMFRITPQDLLRLTGAEPAAVRKASPQQ